MGNQNQNRTPSWKLAIPFFLVLGLLTAVSLIIPLRPTQSQAEKRNLAEFPDFSMENLLSGDYFDDISLWFSDTFPGREGWLSLAAYTQSFQGYSDIAIVTDLPQAETVPEYRPPREPEASEPDPAATEPEETEAPEWGGVDAGEEADINIAGSIIQIGDAMYSALGFSQTESDRYIAAVNDFVQAVEDLDVTVVSAPAPTAIGILVEEQFQEKLHSVSQEKTLAYLHDGMDSSVVKVDTVSALRAHNSEYIYFRTDHHWTALGAYYSYRAVCQALGMEPVELDAMEAWDQGEFVGSQFGRAARPQKLKHDNVVAYIPKGNIVNTVTEKNGAGGFEYPLLADTTQRNKNAKYLVFGTDWPKAHIENRSLPADAPSCVVVKDSFGNCFAPFLTQNFRNVYSLDYRKFREKPLTEFVEEYDIDCVIFMPYLTATQSGQGTKMIRSIALGSGK
ncbi:MAG: DHHW family protein [Eubacteriales bacterium]|nr:DHHW family protein [Eubacteriales bacterium]